VDDDDAAGSGGDMAGELGAGGDGVSSGGDSASGGNSPAGGGSASGGSPASGGAAPVDLGTPLDQRLEVFDVRLSGVVRNGSNKFSAVYPAVRPQGGLTLGWNESDVGHLTRLNADMGLEGVEWDFPGLMIVGALGLPDDGVALLVIDHTSAMTDHASVDRHLRLRILDANGVQTRETSIVGGNGIGVPESWFAWNVSRSVAMVANGDRFSIFTKISRHWLAESGVHVGDLYIEVDENGDLDQSTFDVWSASHSNRQHLVLGPEGEGLRLTVGDGNPFGVEYQVSEQYRDVVVWPHEDQIEAGYAGKSSTISAGDLCGFQYRNGRLFATIGTVRQQPYSLSQDFGDVVLLSWPVDVEQGDPITETWLTDTPAIAELCPTLTAFGSDHQLSVWGERDGTTGTLALLDGDGKLVGGPTASTAPFHKHSLVVSLPGGDVAWTYADANVSTVQVVVARTE